MNIRQIEVFKAVIEAGSVTGAAATLSITQPSVSKHLKLLEHSLGFTLFRRSRNRLTATPEGQALYDQVERVYTGIGFLEDFAEGLRNNQHGELSVASMPLIAHRWLPESLAGFIANHRNISFSLPVRSSNWISTAVAARRIHLGVGLLPASPIAGLRITELMKLPIVCVMQPESSLARHKVIEPEMLVSEDLVSLHSFDGKPLMFERMALGIEADEGRSIETFSANVACELVRQGAGSAFVDAMTAFGNQDDRLTFRPFEPRTYMNICIMTPERWPLSRLAGSVMELMLEAARETEGEIAQVTAEH